MRIVKVMLTSSRKNIQTLVVFFVVMKSFDKSIISSIDQVFAPRL